MSIQLQSRAVAAPAVRSKWPHVSLAALVLATALPPFGLVQLARVAPVLPSMSVVALASAAIIAFAAWCMSADRNSTSISLWDIAGSYAFIGFAAGMISDPEQVMELWSAPGEIRGAPR
jgi:hypothetical protein